MNTKLLLPNHLVFSGGGVKGLSHAGVIKKIENIVKVNTPLVKSLDIKSISGASIGSLIGTMVCLGYTADEILQESLDVDFELFKQVNVFSLIEKYGFDNGMCLHNWFINIINKKYTKEVEATLDPSFIDIYNQTKVKLNIAATCLTTEEIHYFNYENSPDMPVSLAIRMSCSIPLLFETIPYNDNIYIDGCILNEIPCDMIDKENDSYLIFSIRNTQKKQNNNIKNIEEYSSILVMCLYRQICKLNTILNKQTDENTIICNATKARFSDFNLDNEIKKELFEEGYNSDISNIKFFKQIKEETKEEKNNQILEDKDL